MRVLLQISTFLLKTQLKTQEKLKEQAKKPEVQEDFSTPEVPSDTSGVFFYKKSL